MEIVVVDIICYNTKHRFACVYRAPERDEYYLRSLCACMKYICSVTYPCTIIGDFNFDFFYPHQNSLSSEFYYSVYNSDLYQIVCEPNRYNSLLNVILYYSRMNVRNMCIGDRQLNCDHNISGQKRPNHNHQKTLIGLFLVTISFLLIMMVSQGTIALLTGLNSLVSMII